ncbi:MAG: LysR family transcriptional regulator [Pseudomonadota bacterium]
MKINLKQIESFVWVADLGSFRKAARRLNTTQPNISSRIAALETALDVKLMERDAGSVRLTTRGREMLQHARAVMRATDAFIDAGRDSSLAAGTLKLGVTEMVVHTWLREFLKRFKQAYPNIVVELIVDLSVNLERELAERSIDLAFQSGPFTTSVTGSRDLGTYPVVWVASPAIAREMPQSVSISDLARFPIHTHARNTRPYQDIEAHFGAKPDLPYRLVPSSNLSACLHMTIDGLGIAALLLPMVEAELAAGELEQINYDWVPQPLSFFARYDAGKSSLLVDHAAELATTVAKDFIQHRE